MSEFGCGPAVANAPGTTCRIQKLLECRLIKKPLRFQVLSTTIPSTENHYNPPQPTQIPQVPPYRIPNNDMVHHASRQLDNTNEDMGNSGDEDPCSPPHPTSSSQVRPARSSGQGDIGNQPQLVQ